MQRYMRPLAARTHALKALPCAILLGMALMQNPAAQPAAGAGPVVFLDQGWTAAERAWYYQVSQGSAVMSYDLFLNLELAGSQELFRSDANSDRFGLITQPADPQNNPDALPIGLSKTIVRRKGSSVDDVQVGLTCAACHNAQLNYQGKRIRIDGGAANTFDMMGYVGALDDAMQATLADKQKFDRLAVRLGAMSAEAKTELGKRVEREAGPIRDYRTRTLATPTVWGPSRIDAISAIVNRLLAIETRIPQNNSTPLAPTKPPFLWNAPHGSWTQWRASQQDPINRNLVESMGVYLPMNLHSKSPAEGLFESNAQLLNLQQIENQLTRLAPPKWPEEIFGRIDRQKAAAGKALFATHCASCHNAWPYTWTPPNKYGKRFLEVGVVPQKYVGTDPGQFDNLRPYAITGNLAPFLPEPFKDKEVIPTGALYLITQKLVLDKALSELKLDEQQTINLHGYRELPPARQTEDAYKAAPRDGVWATPPFLHNGSVPNLYEMLVPARERTRKFYVGREFDPVKVGLDTSGKSGSFLLDTSLRGNSNAGHSFENSPRGNGVIGPLLTETQRWALVEYLKSIPEEAGRVTPFGGPPNAVTGTSKWSRK
ncbi:di-heme-cytochrome C peroxidase [Variovorax saccharolyticus]|uniref:di-heme-cytochrome C peroxidase n=1 Tax=Variovorax saccharolyticus TaxID=3053516 RepID=UPI0025760F6C|nr:di-heme-cytochrome C peroxidase [Variovorax sp. J22R187]MDM0021408.1 di-heme-cytochrome C peroxidase [Variovorax sp. J22R187]